MLLLLPFSQHPGPECALCATWPRAGPSGEQRSGWRLRDSAALEKCWRFDRIVEWRGGEEAAELPGLSQPDGRRNGCGTCRRASATLVAWISSAYSTTRDISPFRTDCSERSGTPGHCPSLRDCDATIVNRSL